LGVVKLGVCVRLFDGVGIVECGEGGCAWCWACKRCDWCCTGELGGVSVFLLLVGLGTGLGKMRRFGNVLRLPARKTLGVCWWGGAMLFW